jgi:hypothetical protein
LEVPGTPAIIDRMAVDSPHWSVVLEDVRALSAQPNPRLEQVEATLTDGYACALFLETERLRLQRRLEESAGRLGDRPPKDRVAEVTGLARGVAERDDELAQLRAALAVLKETAHRIRAA